MGNDLHRLAQIFAAAFFGEHVPVYLSRSEVGVLVQILVDKAFIMPQVQVGLRAVLGHEYLAVLIGAHGAGVYIDIRVQLLGRHLQTAAFQKAAKRGRRDALAQAGHHAARHKNILRHTLLPLSLFSSPGRPTARRFLMRFYTSTVPVNTSTALPVISTVSPV